MSSFDFTSPTFYVFLPVVVALTVVAGRTLGLKAQLVVLTAASWLFFWLASGWYVLLLAFSTLVDFYIGRALGEDRDDKARRRLVQLSIVVNLGLLAVFKYADLIVRTVLGAGDFVGVQLPLIEPGWVLPIGISFYTFQTMSYSIDRYRRDGPEMNSMLPFGLYVSFFPQLVAGPILRVSEFRSQVQSRLLVYSENLRFGVSRIMLGLFKKLVIADNVGPFVGDVLDGTDYTSPPMVFFAAVCFGLQIYCDFSAYSDIAIGAARMVNIRLPENFSAPYFATNPSEFWRRWHMTLSRWLRDYLYIPLGGNRRGELFTYRNLALTMLLGGLWHGASWNFVLWGALHGLFLAAHRRYGKRTGEGSRFRQVVGWALTQYGVFFAWLVFRVEDTSRLVDVMGAYLLMPLGPWDLETLQLTSPDSMGKALAAVGLFFVLHSVSHAMGGVRNRLPRANPWVWGVVIGLLGVGMWLFAAPERPDFIYFRF